MLNPNRLPPACIAVLIHCTMSSHPCSLSGKSLHFSLSSVEYHRISFSSASVTPRCQLRRSRFELRGLSPHLVTTLSVASSSTLVFNQFNQRTHKLL
jgi:hypothetical protein